MRGMISVPFGTASAPEGGRKSDWTSTITSAVLDMMIHAYDIYLSILHLPHPYTIPR
jgi:hypothetical protein